MRADLGGLVREKGSEALRRQIARFHLLLEAVVVAAALRTPATDEELASMAAGEKAAFTAGGSSAASGATVDWSAEFHGESTGLAAAAQTVGRAARSPLLDSRRDRA